jgi:predicted lipase
METENKLSLAVCKTILNKNGLQYTDDEIIEIRDFLYNMAEMTTNHFQRIVNKQATIIPLTKHENYAKTESIPLYKGEHRRTG